MQTDDSPALSDTELEAAVAEIKATSEAAAREMADSRSDRLDAVVPVETAGYVKAIAPHTLRGARVVDTTLRTMVDCGAPY